MAFFDEVYKVVKLIPKGRVTTYGAVAAMAGSPRASRQVGWALHNNPEPGVIPCHRVIFKDGSLTSGFAFGGREIQKALLEGEGVEVSNDFKVDLDKFMWNTLSSRA